MSDEPFHDSQQFFKRWSKETPSILCPEVTALLEAAKNALPEANIDPVNKGRMTFDCAEALRQAITNLEKLRG